MKQFKPLKKGWYIVSDVIASTAAWILVAHQRKVLLHEEPQDYTGLFTADPFFYKSLSLAMLFWIALFAVGGSYNLPPYKKSRLKELVFTFNECLLGSLVFLFILFLNDKGQHYAYLYTVFFTLLLLQTFLTATGRLLLITIARKAVANIPNLFNSVIIGNSGKFVAAYKEIKKNYSPPGFRLLGFLSSAPLSANGITRELPCLGTIDKIEELIKEKNIQQVILALDKSERHLTEALISKLSAHDIEIKLVPDTLEILAGSVKPHGVPGAVLVDINAPLMAAWQSNVKRLIDVIVSTISLIILSPLMLFVALRTKLSSKGPEYSRNRELDIRAGRSTFINSVLWSPMPKRTVLPCHR